VSVRGAAFLVLAAAFLVLVGFALPLRSRAAAAQEERLLALRERDQALSELEGLKRRSAALQAVSAAGDPGSLRQAVIGSLDDAAVSNVRLTVQPARPPLVASLKFSAEGGFDDLVALSGRIAGPGTGLVLEACQFVSRPQDLRLEINAVGVGKGT
jgi:hypothetical protein